MKNKEQPKYLQIILWTYLYIVIASVLVLIFSIIFGNLLNNFLGFIIGALGSLVGYNLIIKFVNRIKADDNKASAKAVGNFTLRMLIYAFLAYASYVKGLNFYLTFVGLFSIKIVILVDNFLNKEKL